MTAELRRILLEAAVIFFLGSVIGLSVNYQMVVDAFSGKVATAAVPEQGSTVQSLPVPIDLATVEALLEQGAVLVDARAREIFDEGHIAGALSLPLGEVDDLLADFAAQVPTATPVIAYCSGFGCPDSFDLGMLLLEQGYGEVLVFEGGYPQWQDAGLPVEGAP